MDRFLEELAAATATPGGGAAACYVAATGAALVEMCAGLGQKKGKPGAEEVVLDATALRGELVRQAELDGEAFQQVLAAYRLPKEDPVRAQAIAAALRIAALSPLRILDQVIALAKVIARAQEITPPSANSDWESASVFARAAADVAARNVRVNLSGAADAQALASDLEDKLQKLEGVLPKV